MRYKEAREKAVDEYIKERARVGLTKDQMGEALRTHGFGHTFRYGPVYDDWWGTGQGEAVFFERRFDDLWIPFKNGRVAKVGTIHGE